MKLKITWANRILCVFFTISGAALLLVIFNFMFYFIRDKGDFDNYPLTRLSYNKFLNICEYVNCEGKLNENIIKAIFNISLMFVFWIHHIIFANNNFKKMMNSFSSYGVYERGFYCLVAEILLCFIIFCWQPINSPIVSFREMSIDTMMTVIGVLGVLQFVMTSNFILKIDLLGLSRMLLVIKNDELEYPQKIEIYIPYMSRVCRNPQQSGFMMQFIFLSSDFTYGRLLFLGIMLFGIVIGINQEERQFVDNKEYQAYCEIITNRFIPNYLNLLDSDLANRLDAIYATTSKKKKSN